MNYKKQPKGTKWFYVPERFYDAAQRLNDHFEYIYMDYTMLWSEFKYTGDSYRPGKKCRSLTIEVHQDDFNKLTDCMDQYFPSEAWSMDVIENGVILYFFFNN